MKRKTFIQTSLSGLGVIASYPLLNATQNPVQAIEPLQVEIVKEFVGAGHGNLARVQEMLLEYPNLIYSRYDWGNGDFEEAIEGAGHVGNHEIAEYLIAQGARVNLFVLTMLGQTHLVKPILEQYPQLLHAKGPHGFTLLHHANKGGTGADEIRVYLTEKGLTETQIKIK